MPVTSYFIVTNLILTIGYYYHSHFTKNEDIERFDKTSPSSHILYEVEVRFKSR